MASYCGAFLDNGDWCFGHPDRGACSYNGSHSPLRKRGAGRCTPGGNDGRGNCGVGKLPSPVSHPANVLVMGPGGYRFTDYLKLGLPLILVVFGVAALLLPVFWPLR